MDREKALDQDLDVEELALDQTKERPSQFYGPIKKLLEKHSHCSFCGANLHFSYFTDFGKNITQESSKCLECGLKSDNIVHRLQ
jgi:ferredoxin-like protein FixX